MYKLKEGYWSVDTLIFYIVIIILIFILLPPNRKKLKVGMRSYDIGMILAFLILLFISGFRLTGKDINVGYYVNFLTADSFSSYKDQTVEAGFILFNVIVKYLFDNYSVFIFLMSLFTLVPVFCFVKRNVDSRDARYALTIYTAVYFISGFSAARQFMALSLCLLAYDCMKRKRFAGALIWILLASSFHVTALVMFIPYFATVIRNLGPRSIIFSVLTMFLTMYLLKDSFISMVGGRYAIYSAFDDISFGTRWIAYYVPIFYLLIREVRREKDRYVTRLNVSIVAAGFLFEMLGHIIAILGRMESISITFICILPYYIGMEPVEWRKKLYKIVLLAYCGLRFWMYLSDHYLDEGLMPYSNIFFSLN